MAKRFTVLVSRDGGVSWARHESKASSPDAAINAVRKDPELTADTDTQFVALATFRPRKMKKQIIEKWALAPVDDNEPAQTELGEESS